MIISISGKKGSGKDTVANLIKYLMSNTGTLERGMRDIDKLAKGEYDEHYTKLSGWETKRFADKLKDTVCLWLGCTREQLEDPKFKETPLGEEWVKYRIHDSTLRYSDTKPNHDDYTKEIMTPRKLMQLLGTDCGRKIIHPNIWVNSLFVEYKSLPGSGLQGLQYPNWIIPDTRFPNELAAVEKRDGIKIRVSRRFKYIYPEKWNEYKENANKETTTFYDYLLKTDRDFYESLVHPSETSLDHYSDWHWTIENNGNIKELVGKVKYVLQVENLL